MDVDRETQIEIAVSVVAVGVFIAAVLAIGATFGNGGMGQQGAFALVGLIVGFIAMMTAVGYWLSGLDA
jgi:high-affinity Fe2+/Pb2+ permease